MYRFSWFWTMPFVFQCSALEARLLHATPLSLERQRVRLVSLPHRRRGVPGLRPCPAGVVRLYGARAQFIYRTLDTIFFAWSTSCTLQTSKIAFRNCATRLSRSSKAERLIS